LVCISLNWFKLGFSTAGEICTQSHSCSKQATHQKSQARELACKSYTQDTLLLNFKITQKAFGFKPESNSQGYRAKLLEYNKTGLTIFGFFYKFLWIFKVG
jgi:hypothetical protein